ncbi:MAG: ABC transporter ATP-binding protein [Beijerinckiaceae bacterium]|nr:ABC transporter ATP-binding protein [Beijerinckiaceae bacterium]
MNFMQPITDTVLQVHDLHTHFLTETAVVKAVNGVSFSLKPGERVAIVGESGSGKSAMAMSLIRLLAYPGKIVSGEVIVGGRDITKLSEAELNGVRGSEVGTIFQDPMSSLDPVMRVSEQMIPPIMRNLGLPRKEARDIAVGWLDRVGIPDAAGRIDAYPFEMSGGMRQRVMIAMALSCNPRLIIADEPTTALDVTIQAQIVELLKNLTAETGAAMLFITHDLGLVARFAHKVGVMYAGKIVEFGSAADVFAHPRHPYTQSLLRTIPNAAGAERERLLQIPGFPPDMRNPPVGCSFRERCAAAQDRCAVSTPELTFRGVDHSAACFLPNGLNDAPAPPKPVKRAIRLSNEADLVPQQDILEMHNLRKHFPGKATFPWSKPKTVRAVNGVNLRMRKGETLGIVGESGCGKSTLARLLLGLDEPTTGEIFIAGIAQMVFQDPYSSFNPKMTIFNIIEEPLIVTGAGTRPERAEKVRALIKQVGLEESYLDRYPNQLSGGQRQRVGVARALALNPSVVVADEPTSALDVSVRAQIINLLCDLKDDLGISFIFISHDLLTVRYISDRIAVMYLGEVVEYGPAEDVFLKPAHPYTRALIDAIPTPDPAIEAQRSINIISGELPSPLNIPTGCAFASRCFKVTDRCREEKPVLVAHSQKRDAACHFPL